MLRILDTFGRLWSSHAPDGDEDEVGGTDEGEEEGDPTEAVGPAGVRIGSLVVGTGERSQSQHQRKSCTAREREREREREGGGGNQKSS